MQFQANLKTSIPICLAIVLWSGCRQQVLRKPSTEIPSHLQIHNAGTILSGQVIRHTFTFTNETPRVIELQDDDISRSCGCSEAHIIPRRLPPQGKADVTVEFDSSQKRGEIAEVVTTQWRDRTGTMYEAVFGIRAIAQAPLACTPAELSFTREEVMQGKKKTVAINSDINLDWQALTIHPNHDALQVKCSRQQASQQILEIACLPSSTGEPQQSHIVLSVPEHETQTSHQTTLPVYWHSPAELRISPQPVVPQRLLEHWSATFIMTGDKLREGLELQRISAEQNNVDFTTRCIGQEACRVKLRLKPQDFDSLPKQLTLCFSDGSTYFLKLTPPSLNRSRR